MSLSEQRRVVHVDFARAAELLPYLEKDIAALDQAVAMYWQNFSRFRVKFGSLFHSAGEAQQPDPDHPLNRAAENLELSHLIKLYELIAAEESVSNPLHRLEQNTERMRSAHGLLAAYLSHFTR